VGRHRQSGGDRLGCFDGLRLNEAQISLRLRKRVLEADNFRHWFRGRIGGHRLFLNLRPNPGEGDWLLVLVHQRAPMCSPFLLGIFYCRIFCVKNVRIQYMYIALARIDNPLSRSNRYLPELGTKIQTELTTNYNMPF
jgi:hypothetical protein